MSYLDDFVQGYTTAMLWANATDEDGNNLDETYSVEDFAPEALETMRADCTSFVAANQADLEAIGPLNRRNRGGWSNGELAGHDFALTRNHHGAGFWDRGYGPVGNKLTDAAEAYGENYVYVGDDGQLYTE